MMQKERTDNEFGQSIRGTTFGILGNEFQFSDWGIPFVEEMTDLLEEAGFDKSLNDSPEMEAKEQEGNPMALGEHTPLVQLVIYVAAEIGNWGIGRFCDLVLEAGKRVFGDKGYRGRVSIAIQFKNDLSIAVNGPASSIEDINRLVTSILEAQQRTLANPQFSKTTHKTLIYSLRDGKLPDQPTIIE